MTITIIVLLSVAVVVLVVLVALLIRYNMYQGEELRQKNDVIVHEVRRNQSLINRSIAGAASLFFLLVPFTAAAQTGNTEPALGWYVGIEAGTALGQCTFRSISEHKTRFGWQGGVMAGYQFTRLVSVEGSVVFGGQKMGACDCCPYWLGDDGNRYYAPANGHEGWYYKDLTARTSWQRIGAQVNFDVISLLYKRYTRWSINLSPQLSAVHTSTDIEAADGNKITFSGSESSQWHLGLGGQVAAGYKFSKTIGVQLFGGITCLTGSRFDMIPKYYHKSNLIYEGGLRLTYNIK